MSNNSTSEHKETKEGKRADAFEFSFDGDTGAELVSPPPKRRRTEPPASASAAAAAVAANIGMFSKNCVFAVLLVVFVCA